MSYITREYIAQRVFNRISPTTSEEVSKLYIYQIKSFLPQACNKLATKAMNSPYEYRENLTITKVLTAASGVYIINDTSVINPFAKLMRVDSIPTSFVKSTDNNWGWSYVPNTADLYYPSIGNDLIYYSIQNNIIHTREPNDKIDSRTLPVTIENAVFIPAITDDPLTTTLPPQLEDDLVDIVFMLCRDKLISMGNSNLVNASQ